MNKRKFFSVPAVVFFFLFAVSPANGDQVTPSDRVSTHVNVRQEPLTGS
jgi:hypothetical protein